ncbi:MAG: MFS transporter [Planctomycetes bacterium]|nr:MFS transporter [Planctomycetota bacterium]
MTVSDTKPEPPKLSPQARKGVFTVWLIIFIDLLGFGIVLPSLAYYVDMFEMPAWATSAANFIGIPDSRGGIMVGAIMTAYSLFQFIFAPIWGRLSDKVGRKPILAMSTLGFSITWIIFAFAPTFTWLLISRALAGLFSANLSTAQAYMADVFPAEKRAKGMGLIGMAFGLGFVFGPAIGAILASDWLLGLMFEVDSGTFDRARLFVPALFAATLSAIAFLLSVFRMQESLTPEQRAKPDKRLGRFSQMFTAMKKPGIRTMLIVYFLVTLGFANLEAMFSQFNKDKLELGQSANMWVFVTIGLTLACVQGGLIGRITRKLGSEKVLKIGLLGLSVAMVFFGFQVDLNPGLSTLMWVIIASVFIGAFNSLCNPSILALISKMAAKGEQGGTMGFTSSAATLGRIIGPLAGGILYDAAGPEWPFAIGGILIFMGLLVFVFRRRTEYTP